jgi:RES domain-containing protein
MLLAGEGKPVPSWIVARRLMSEGFAGILVPSFAPGATEADVNLVLWIWGDALPHKITPYDPHERLPKDDRSWSPA